MTTKIKTRTQREVFTHWVKALRSGDYEQGSGQLKTSFGFCCLGVLCDLARKDGGPDWVSNSTHDDEFLGADVYLPGTIATFMGLPRAQQETLAAMNDTDKTFDEIADHIEKYYVKGRS